MDSIERHYLMLQASVEHHVKHKTEMKELCDKLDSMITELKDDFEREYKFI